MIFTRLITIAAWVMLVGSIFRLITGFGIATEIFGPYEEALRRYGGRAENSGAIIDRGFYGLLIAFAFGTLGEISKHLQKLMPEPVSSEDADLLHKMRSSEQGL